jgi:hypothetical protein
LISARRQGLLEHHGGHFGQPHPLRRHLGRGQPGRQFGIGEVRLPGLVRVPPRRQPVVEHHPGAAERLPQRGPVPRLRVEATIEPKLHTLTIPASSPDTGIDTLAKLRFRLGVRH